MLQPNRAIYLGSHLILDIWTKKVDLLKSTKSVGDILVNSAIMAGATVLSERFHEFGEECGITGVIVLSESHISIHTWPEREYAAIDIFMCGSCNPHISANFIDSKFESYKMIKTEILRGVEKGL